MKKIIWYVLALFFLGLVVAIFVWLYTFRKAELSVASQKAEITISSSDLLNKFTMNEESANTAFLDKVIIVSGIVDKITEDSLSVSIYLKTPEDIAGVMCGFNKSEIDKSAINPGDPIKIKGICTGYLMDVVLNKCSIEE